MSNKTSVTHPPSSEFSIIYDLYAPAVYGFISGILPQQEDAESVLAKIFSNLYREIEMYAHKDKLLLWLIQLSRNECVARLISANEKTPGAPVNAFVTQLPTLEKTIFALVYFKGLAIDEIARLLRLPASKIQDVFNGLPKFTTYLFEHASSIHSPITDILQSLVQNIIPENDALRVAALKRYEILYTPAEVVFDKLTDVVARVFDSPMAFLSLVDKDTVFYKSQVGPFGRSQVNRENSLCSLTILSREPLIIEDASLQGCFAENPFVQAEGGIRFYAGVPLITSDGFLIGALCVVDTKPRTFSPKDSMLLTSFAETAMLEIEARHVIFQQTLLQEQLKAALLQG